MKVCFVHNEYGKFSGEEAVVQGQLALLQLYGHGVCSFMRSSTAISKSPFGQVKAFFSGIYNPFVKKHFIRFIENERPDLVHIHNLYPLISPSVLDACEEMRLPVVMSVHNYRLICPNGLLMVRGEVCERCAGGREYHCLFRNCEGNVLKSLGYALRNYSARVRKSYVSKVTSFAVLTEFQRCKFIEHGYNRGKIEIIPNMVDFTPGSCLRTGDFIGYVGRMSQEKGVETLVAAAGRCEDIAFKAAGDFAMMPDLPRAVPANFEFLGQCDRVHIKEIYMQSRAMVFCSICYEGFPMVLVEAMLCGKPVIASRIGGIPEIVDDGVTGMLFEPGNVNDLAEKIRFLWERPELCEQLGQAGREKANREYSSEQYYQRLMKIYKKAIVKCQNDY